VWRRWNYVNGRRLFVFVDRSIYAGTHWVVFEPNDLQHPFSSLIPIFR
jgi:phage tail sheath protein FI